MGKVKGKGKGMGKGMDKDYKSLSKRGLTSSS